MTNAEKRIKTGIFGSISAVFTSLFVFILIAVKFIDISAIGPEGSQIGLSAFNASVRDFLGTNTLFYDISEKLGLIVIAVAGGFAIFGIIRLIKVKSIKRVEHDILLLGALYILMAGFYILFEAIVINYRPILVDGVLEASFPSSHTMLAITVMGSAIYLFSKGIKKSKVYIILVALYSLVLISTVTFRLLSGVHWISDILAGICLGGAMVFAYITLCIKFQKQPE